MTVTVQVLVTGLAAGGVYGLVGIAHSVVFRLTGIVHFALGDLIGLAAFTTLLVAGGTTPVATTAGSWRLVAGIGVGLAVCVVVGALGYFLVVAPYLGRSSALGWIAGTLALAFAARAVVSMIFVRSGYVFPDVLPFDRIGSDGYVSLAGARVHVRAFAVAAVAVAVAGAVSFLLQRTRFGHAVDAVVQDEEGAHVVGIPVERTRAAAFGLAGGVAALVVVVAAPGAPFDTLTGPLLGVKGLAAAVLAGFGRLPVVFAAGIAFGLAEAGLGNGVLDDVGIGADYRELLPLAAALVLLAARPQLVRRAHA